MTTFGDVKSRVRRQIGDDFGGQYSDTDVVRWINAAVREIVLTNDLLQKTATSALVGDQYEYPLPNDVMKLHTLTFRGVPLDGMGFREFMVFTRDADAQAHGLPQIFTVWAGKIRIYPYPHETPVPQENIQIFYTYKPAAITGGSEAEELPLETIYENRIVEYCIAQANEMNEDREGYALKMQEFQTGVRNTQDEHWEDDRGAYPVISVVPEDYGHYGYYHPYAE